MTRSLRHIVILNIVLVLVIAAVGVWTDEAYWRENGHEGGAYAYVFWVGLALNGPSGFLADWLANGLLAERLAPDDRFVAQHLLWLVLLCLQWIGYGLIARAAGTVTRRRFVYAVSMTAFVVGWAYAARAWSEARQPHEFFRDTYFWACRFGGLACAGAWVCALVAARAHSAIRTDAPHAPDATAIIVAPAPSELKAEQR